MEELICVVLLMFVGVLVVTHGEGNHTHKRGSPKLRPPISRPKGKAPPPPPTMNIKE